jgi:hypothetical protein
MLRQPGMIERAVHGKIECHLQSVIGAGLHLAPEVVERAEL